MTDGPEGWRAVSSRQILVASTIAETGSISAAARALGLQQSTVSRMTIALEEALGSKLFARSGNATRLTAAGALLEPRFAYFATLLRDTVAWVSREPAGTVTAPAVLSFLSGLSMHRAGQLLAMQDARSVRASASVLGLSADAVRKILRRCHRELCTELFLRPEGGSLAPTPFGSVLLPRIRLMRREVANAATDLATLAGLRSGVLQVGCLPSAAASLVPLAVARTLSDSPSIQVKLAEGTYDELIQQLQSGHLDLVIGGLEPAADFAQLQCDVLYEDRLCIFARRGHPLAGRRRPSVRQLSRFRWVVPTRGPLAKPVLELLLAKSGIRPHLPGIECASIVALNGLLQATDVLTIGSPSQMSSELRTRRIVELAYVLPAPPWSCGVISRAGAPPSVAMGLFVESLRAVTSGRSEG